ncbi:MAG: alpha/beta hydrolase [Pseudomonadota bacterium]
MSLLLIALASSALGACVHSMIYTSRVEAAHPASGDLLEVDGHDVHIIETGPASGSPVLFIHGASANANEFTWTLGPRLESDHRILIADRPGHGYSDRAPNADRLDVQAAQLAGALGQKTGGRPAVVVGHSFGGAVALRLALDHPDLVAGLVLLAPVSHDWGGGGQTWYNQITTTPLIGPAFSNLVPLVGPGLAEDGAASTFSPADVPEGYFDRSGTGLLFRPPNFRANANDVVNVREELQAQQARYGDLTMPIIVFSGLQDTVIKPELHVGRLKDEAPNLELIELPNGGHMPHHEVGADIAEAIARLAMGGEPR